MKVLDQDPFLVAEADPDGLVAAVLATAREDLGLDLIFTSDTRPIRGHPSIDVVSPDGSLLGTLTSRHHLRRSDFRSVVALAGLLGRRLGQERLGPDALLEQAQRIRRVLHEQSLQAALQPIFDLKGGGIVGYEALARFPPVPGVSTQLWFAEAEAAGLGLQLERAAARAAVALFETLPGSTFLAINASPALAVDRCFRESIRDLPHERLVIEMTEHAAVEDYDRFEQRLMRRRLEGVRLAVDDTGAGFASLRHILRLRPDLIKLDISLVRGVDLDPLRQSLVAAVVGFAGSLGSAVVAEGLESDAELQKVQALGVQLGQGFLLGVPKVQPVVALAAS